MVRCWRTRAKTGIIQTEIGSVQLVILIINYASAERLGWRWRRSWICDTEHNNPNENAGYNTQPAFVIPGTKATERNTRHKKNSVPVLQNVPNRHWEVSGLIQSQYSAPHGLMTPKMPDSFLMHVDSGNHYRPGQEDVFTAPQIPQDFPRIESTRASITASEAFLRNSNLSFRVGA